VPLVVSAAQGNGIGSDRIGTSTSTLTWSGLTDATTNYLYVTVNTDGTLTTGSTTVAPAFQNGGTAANTVGLGTFDYARMVMYYGTGVSAPAAWIVYVGEAVTSGGAVTSTVQYAYNGRYRSANIGLAVSQNYAFSHNIGAPCAASTVMVCIDGAGEASYVVGAEINYDMIYSTVYYNGVTSISSYKSGNVTVAAGGIAAFSNIGLNVFTSLTESKWRLRVSAERAF
jgi:hypothetical protein